MSTTVTHIRNSFHSIGEINPSYTMDDLVLKLHYTKNFLRYFVFASTKSELIYFGDYTIHHTQTEDELKEQLQNILEKDAALKRTYKKVFIGADSTFDLLPAAFFSGSEDHVDSLLNGSVYLVYSFSKELELLFLTHFESMNILHIGGSLIAALQKEHNTLIERLYVNINHQTVDITSFSGEGKFQFFNTYTYKSATDFIYFVLLVADELKTNRENCELILSGEVDINSKIYELCYRYFKNISFLKPSADLHFSKAFEHFPKHFHYNIYNLGI